MMYNKLNFTGEYNKRYFYYALFAFFSSMVFLFSMQYWFGYPSDLTYHIDLAANGDTYSLSGFVTFLTAQILPQRIYVLVNVILLAFCNIASVLLIRNALAYNANLGKNSYLTDALAFSLFIVSMLFLPFEVDAYVLRGSPNVWHNSTFIVCRLFAVLTVLKFFEMFNHFECYLQQNMSTKALFLEYVKLTIYSALCMFAKPSFLVAFLPAISIILAIKFLMERKNFLLYLGIAVSFSFSLVIIFVQSKILFDASGESVVVFDPFKLILFFHGNYLTYFLQLSLHIAFPLFVFCATIRKINFEEKVIYLTALVAFLTFWLFAESGPRFKHANFMWGTLLSSFFCFYIGVVRLLKADTPVRIKKVGFFIYALHLICGMIYYLKILCGFKYR